MFKSFETIENITDQKNLISYVEDAFKHLAILQKIPFTTVDEGVVCENLIHLGFIEKKESFVEFMKLVKHKTKIEIEHFSALLMSINYEQNFCILPKICKSCRLKKQQAEKISGKPTIVDLFSGSGGMSLGFTQAGFRIIFANDIEPSCVETYTYNHPEVDPSKVVLGDIQNFATTVSDYTADEHVDIVIGGPPCQGFSNANKQRIIDDPRNKLYKEYVNVVASVRPSFFVMENVVGMKDIAAQVVEDFEALGYTVDFRVLNAVSFGAAQQRKRLIFIGNKFNIENKRIFDEIEDFTNAISTQTLRDAIGDLPELKALRVKNATNYESDENGYFIRKMNDYKENDYLSRINDKQIPKFIYNHKARYNNDRDIEIFSRLEQGDKSDDPKIADIMPYTNRNDIFKDKYFKLIYDQPCKTITAHMKFDCNMYIHPTQARGLTPREAARVQTYPDDYFFKGSFTKTYMQIGNSVPPVMAKGIAKVIKKYIDEINLTDEQFKLSLNY